MQDLEQQLKLSRNELADLKEGFQSVLGLIDKMEHLGQVQDRLDITCDVERIWQVLSGEIRQFATAEVCALIMVDDETHDFILKDVLPHASEKMCRKEMEMQIDCGTFSWIIGRRQPSIIPSLAFKRNRTVIMLPLSTARKTLGSVMLLTPIRESAITQETLKLLGMLARQCSLVLENALLYDSLRKEHESLKQAQARILQAEKLASIGRLTSGAFHEILNPLNIISGYIQMMGMNKDLDVRIRGYLDILKEQSDRITNIVKDLLKFSQFSKQKVKNVRIHRLIEKAIKLVEHELKYDKIKIICDFAADVPEIRGDDENLTQVFCSLLSNARDAMPEGGTVRISTRLEHNGDRPSEGGNRIRVRVADDGCGISEENANRVFDPFFTTKETGEGTGLGLSLSYGIVKEHAGQIRVESKVAAGTTFIVDLPAGTV